MASVTYAIVFSGEILEGHQAFSVKAHMSKMLKADADKMQTLFSGKQVVLKRTTDKQQAMKIGSALKKIGADVKIKAVKQEAPAEPAPAASADAPAASGNDGDWSLAPMEGNIVEPQPAPRAPDIDLSNLEIREMDDEPLAAPRRVQAPQLDLSEYSVSENDGSPLVEPSNAPMPEVEAPDFGLDEPGAELETLHEEREEVHPDISNLTLAEPGSDLLEDKDRTPPPPPKAPDVSGLSLAEQ